MSKPPKTRRVVCGKLVSPSLRNTLRETADAADAVRAAALFAEKGIPIWFHGGFAVDAFTGVTNEHGDIDAFCRLADRDRIIRECEANLVLIGHHGLILNVGGARLEISWVAPWRRGLLISVSNELIWRFREDAFGHAVNASLDGAHVPIIHPKYVHMELTHVVWRKKRFYEKHMSRGALVAEHLRQEDLDDSRRLWPALNTWKNRLLVRLGIFPKPRPKHKRRS
jgi:hypothetical protein